MDQTVAVSNQGQSVEINHVLHTEDKKKYWEKPKDSLIASYIDRIYKKIYERFSSARQAFKYFDSDCNGGLSFWEFRGGVEALGINLFEEEYEKVFEYMDIKKKGKIKYIDFSKSFQQKEMTRSELENAELKFLQNPIQHKVKYNYLHDSMHAVMKGAKGPKKPLFGIANTGQNSLSTLMRSSWRSSSNSKDIMNDILSQGSVESFALVPKNVAVNQFNSDILE